MSDYRSNLDLAQAAARLAQSKRVAVTTHAKPDGDAFGSAVSITAALREMGIEASTWLIPPVPAPFQSLRGWDLTQPYESTIGSLDEPDMVVICDTGAWSQVEPMKQTLSGLLDRTLIIDHHLTGDIPAAWRYIDGQAAACCELIAQLLDVLSGLSTTNVDLWTPTVCDALFVGVASDTGWFRFSNTRPYTHELAARLLECGVDHAQIYARIEQGERPEKLALTSRALDGLELIAGHRAAMMVLRAEDFVQTGSRAEEAERLVDIPQMVSTVQLVVLVTQAPSLNGQAQPVKISFRSKPGREAIDVSQLAAQFGGGGHARAAGARIHAPLDDVLDQVHRAVVQSLDDVP